jgi:PleD family two-component response regulator
VLLLPGATELEPVLERFRQGIQALDLVHEGSQTAKMVTVSCGGFVAAANGPHHAVELLQQADALLY